METATGFLIYAALYRLAMIAAGVVSIVLGYRLFVRGVMPGGGTDANAKGGTEVNAKAAGIQLSVKNAAPGTCFALFGVVIISVMAVDGRPQLELKRFEAASTIDQSGGSGESVFIRGDPIRVNEDLAAFRVQMELGDERRKQGDGDGAIAAYAEALSHPGVTLGDAVYPLSRIADLYLEQDRVDEALPRARVAFGADPKNPEILDTLARILLWRGDAGDALKAARAAVAGDPKNAAYGHTLALCLEAAGHHAEAIEAMREAAERDPRFKEALAALEEES